MKTEKSKSAIQEIEELKIWFMNTIAANDELSKTPEARVLGNLAIYDYDFNQLSNMKESENPLYELSWGDHAFRTAAQLDLGIKFLSWAKRNHDEKGTLPSIEKITDQLLSDVVQKTRNLPRSSSSTSNMAECATLQAKAELLTRCLYHVSIKANISTQEKRNEA